MISVIAIYILSVWILSPLAAFLFSLVGWFGGLSITESPVSPDFSLVSWYWNNTLFVAGAWLGPAEKLRFPEIRTWWLGVNTVFMLLAVMLAIRLGPELKRPRALTSAT